MAWTGTDLALYDKFLKEWYMGKWIDLLNNLTTTYKLSRKRIVNFQGRRMVIALRTGRTGAVGAIPVSGFVVSGSATSQGAQSLMNPAYQGTNNALVRPKLVMGAIGIPQDVIDVSASDKGAFYEVIDFEMMGLKTDMANYLDKTMYKGGAPLADITSVTSHVAGETIFVVDNTYPFYVGQRLEFWSSNTTGATAVTSSEGTPIQVTAIDRATRSITVDKNIDTGGASAGDLGATDQVYTAGARSANVAYEPLGYEEIIKESAASTPTATAGDLLLNTYEGTNHMYGLSRETGDSNYVAEWASNILDVGGTNELEFRHMHEILDDVHDNSGGDPTVFLTTRVTRRHVTKRMAYTSDQVGAAPGSINVVGTSQRFMNTTRLKGGFIGAREDMHGQGGNDWVLFDDRVPIVVDRYATHDYANDLGTMYAIDSRHCFWALVTDWKWWAPEGRILREASNSSGPQFGVLAHAYLFGEHVVDAPNTCGRIFNFATDNA